MEIIKKDLLIELKIKANNLFLEDRRKVLREIHGAINGE